MKIVTLWYRYVKKEIEKDKWEWIWEYNHLEENIPLFDNPIPRTEEQNQAWKNVSWKKEFLFITRKRKIIPSNKRLRKIIDSLLKIFYK